MIVTLDSKRRLTIPVSVASASPGDAFEVTFDADEDAFVFRRIAPNSDWLEVLKACPIPMDDVPSRRSEFPRHREL
jgi:hypothetical protein